MPERNPLVEMPARSSRDDRVGDAAQVDHLDPRRPADVADVHERDRSATAHGVGDRGRARDPLRAGLPGELRLEDRQTRGHQERERERRPAPT